MRPFALFAAARRSLPRLVPLFRDHRVPAWLKTATVFGALLIVSPLDIFGDFPVLGQIDDIVLLMLLMNLFVLLAGRFALREAAVMRRAQPARPAQGQGARIVGPIALNR